MTRRHETLGSTSLPVSTLGSLYEPVDTAERRAWYQAWQDYERANARAAMEYRRKVVRLARLQRRYEAEARRRQQ